MPRKKDPLVARIEELTVQLEGMREQAMRRAGFKTFGVKDVASFHGTIGSKNNEYVDAIRQVFLSPEQFLAEWKQGALDQAAEWDNKELEKYGRRYQNHAVHDILRLLKDKTIRDYIELFLERNFYKQYGARVRAKPAEALWEVWMGHKNQEYGLLITPRFKGGEWENDVSHIRRVSFDYWTIGHVLSTGFVIPHVESYYKTSNLDDLFQFYKHAFVRAQGSIHSTRFANEYEKYVRSHTDPSSLPFMIPEFRYTGATGPHKYRLDFAILSAVNHKRIGIELSPWSTHGRVIGKKALIKSGGTAAVEKKQIETWEKDTAKRNDYFIKFGITTLTLTDQKLSNISDAFDSVKPYLGPSVDDRRSNPEVDREIGKYTFDDGGAIDLTK